ncbi:hypothetical protein ACQEV2_19675 [Streptomyces sp. CA-251387]|uniref:hypothetical protein n=1 Tax=Streptomyces sp. CA-251387 TaxID=3240064 RepID=UPI003D89D87B
MTEQTETQAEPQPPAVQPAPESAVGDPAVGDPAAGDPGALNPGAPDLPASDAPAPPPARKDRRVLRAVGRWVAVVTVFGVFGAGSAYGIARMERTDVPGLATESDGRWVYPELTRPPLPAGRPGPLAADNQAGAHYADLRGLLLPAPEGATEDKALRGDDGWLATKDFLAVYEPGKDRTEAGQTLTDYGLRHVAARGWTTPDGTRTGVYLLQFDTGEVADEIFEDFTEYDAPVHALRGAAEAEYDKGFPAAASLEGVRRFAYDESKPYGPEQLRQAYVVCGDVVALVVQSRKGTAAAVPFQQTVMLQSQLLG